MLRVGVDAAAGDLDLALALALALVLETGNPLHRP